MVGLLSKFSKRSRFGMFWKAGFQSSLGTSRRTRSVTVSKTGGGETNSARASWITNVLVTSLVLPSSKVILTVTSFVTAGMTRSCVEAGVLITRLVIVLYFAGISTRAKISPIWSTFVSVDSTTSLFTPSKTVNCPRMLSVLIRPLNGSVFEANGWAAVSYTHLTLPTIYSV